MGTTPNKGLRYPEPTDRVNQGAQAIEDLALDVDGKLAQLDTALAGKVNDAHLQTHARFQGTSAGAQYDAGSGKQIIYTGLTWSEWAVVWCWTVDQYGNQKPAPQFSEATPSNGVIYWPNGTWANGQPIRVAVIDNVTDGE